MTASSPHEPQPNPLVSSWNRARKAWDNIWPILFVGGLLLLLGSIAVDVVSSVGSFLLSPFQSDSQPASTGVVPYSRPNDYAPPPIGPPRRSPGADRMTKYYENQAQRLRDQMKRDERIETNNLIRQSEAVRLYNDESRANLSKNW